MRGARTVEDVFIANPEGATVPPKDDGGGPGPNAAVIGALSDRNGGRQRAPSLQSAQYDGRNVVSRALSIRSTQSSPSG
jgi:hypothetical protein